MKDLVLGGVGSGKSRLAEQLAQDSGFDVRCIVTARAGHDSEMAARIQLHRERRPPLWQVVEEPVELAAALQLHAAEDCCLLVDCLTLWLTNLLCMEDDALLKRERTAFVEAQSSLPGRIIYVANETGLGIVPLGELTRRFVDEAGMLNQQLARSCERVILTVAGLPHLLKGDLP